MATNPETCPTCHAELIKFPLGMTWCACPPDGPTVLPAPVPEVPDLPTRHDIQDAYTSDQDEIAARLAKPDGHEHEEAAPVEDPIAAFLGDEPEEDQPKERHRPPSRRREEYRGMMIYRTQRNVGSE